MAKLSILTGATSQSVNVFIQDSSSTVGAGLSGLAFNTSGLIGYYTFAGTNATSVQISLVTLAAVNSAFSSGGFKEIDATNMKGLYRLDLPNAAIASAKGRSVTIMLSGATNMAPLALEIELTGWDNQDATAGGLSRIDAAVSSRMATYTQPTGFLAATFPTGTVANTTNITAGTITTVTNLTNAPTAGDLTATMKTSVAAAVWTDTTAGDFTTALSVGKSLMNGVALGTGLTVAAVSGAVGSVTGAVGSVTGNVGGNVVGSVASVTAGVTVTTNNDKTGYSLTQTFPTNFSALGISAGGHISNVDTLTTYTGNTVQTGDGFARLGAPAGASVSADIAAVKTDTAAVKVQTDKFAFTVANQIDANVLDWKSATAPAMTGDAFARLGAPAGASIAADIAAVESSVTGLNNISTAQVKTQVVAALATDTYAEPGQGAPAATTTLATKISFLYKAWRNKTTQDASTYSLFNDDAATVDHKATVSDDGSTFTKGEVATGP